MYTKPVAKNIFLTYHQPSKNVYSVVLVIRQTGSQTLHYLAMKINFIWPLNLFGVYITNMQFQCVDFKHGTFIPTSVLVRNKIEL